MKTTVTLACLTIALGTLSAASEANAQEFRFRPFSGRLVSHHPHIADLLKKQLDGTLLEIFQASPASTELLSRLAENQGVYLQSYGLLSRGAIITGLLWGSILAFLIERDLRNAMFFALLASFLSLVGLIHAEQIGFTWSPISIGYLILTALLGLFALWNSRQTKRDRAQGKMPG